MGRVIMVLDNLGGKGGPGLGAMSLAKLNVAMTRVKLLRHLAIWPCSGGMDHLHKLAPNPMLAAWQAHYTGTGLWRAGEQLVPRDTFPNRVLQAGTLARATNKDIQGCCKKLGMWITGRSRLGMGGDLAGAFALALAQHNTAGAAAAAAAPSARARWRRAAAPADAPRRRSTRRRVQRVIN